MTTVRSQRFADLKAGDEVPTFELPLTYTRIVAGAIASRDFMPAHHEKAYAVSQGAHDIFLNILTTNGLVARYITDWAGPESILRSIKIRLGAPAIPGHVLKFTGRIESVRSEGDEGVVEVTLEASTELGAHATGTATVSLPA